MKIKELEQRLNRIEQEKAAIRHQISEERRKGDLRKKILYGVAALTLASQDPDLQTRLLRHLDDTVTRPDERTLLGLSVKDA